MYKDYWKGEKIVLRSVEARDISFFERLDADRSKYVDMIQFPRSRDQWKYWLEKEAKKIHIDAFRWVAENREGEAIGTIDTFACDRRNGTFKYALIVDGEHKRNGYAKEMIQMVLQFYFCELGYQKATPYVYSYNDASIRLHRKLGFQEEGRLRSMVYTRGNYHDEIHFGMLKREFDRLFPSPVVETS